MRNILYFIFMTCSTITFSQGYNCAYPYLQEGDSLYQIGIRDKKKNLLEKALQAYNNGLAFCCTQDRYNKNKEDCDKFDQKIKNTKKEIKKLIPIPEPVFVNPVPDKHEEELWDKVKNSNEPAYIKTEYLDKCKVCKYGTLANARIDTLNDQIRWNQVKNSKDTAMIISSYLQYCYPPNCNAPCLCMFKVKAINLKNDLANQIKIDESSWRQVKNSDNIDSIQSYINSCSWPCKHKGEAAEKIKEIIKNSKPQMTLISGGLFKMGNTFKGKVKEDETPHPARVKDFYIGIKEVTFREFDAFCTETNFPKPPDNGWGRVNRPVINVSWFDAVRYCNWRSTKDGFIPYYSIDESNTVEVRVSANGYRLPTEAEWEYAAREGGQEVKFGNGQNSISPQTVNYDVFPPVSKSPSQWSTLPTGFFKIKNKLELFDMSGNVAEWCYDWYGENYYKIFNEQNPAIDVVGPDLGDTKVIRGGAYNYREDRCTVFCRNFYKPEIQRNYIGFRVARNK